MRWVLPPTRRRCSRRLFLVLAGYAAANVALVLAAILIAGGGVLAAKDMIRKG